MEENILRRLELEEQRREIEKLKKEILRRFLTREAIERLGRVRLVKPELVEQLEIYLINLYQAGKLKEVIDDNKLKQILTSLNKKDKTQFRIIR